MDRLLRSNCRFTDDCSVRACYVRVLVYSQCKALSLVNYIGVGLVIWADLINVGNGFRTDDSVYQARTE